MCEKERLSHSKLESETFQSTDRLTFILRHLTKVAEEERLSTYSWQLEQASMSKCVRERRECTVQLHTQSPCPEGMNHLLRPL